MADSRQRPLPGPCILVTGALGFVGRHLARSLLLAGQPVVGLGKHPPGADLPLQVGPFALRGAVPELPGAVIYTSDAGTMWYVPLDLAEPAPIAELVARLSPAAVYHLAAQSSAAVSFQQPGETMASNVKQPIDRLIIQ